LPEALLLLKSARQPRLLSSSVVLLSLFPQPWPSLKLPWLLFPSLYHSMFLIILQAVVAM